MKKDISLVLIVALCMGLSGCFPGELTGKFRETTYKTSDKLNIDQPLRIDKKEFLSIKKVAIMSQADLYKNPDSLRIYSMMLRILVSDLEKSKQFKIVYPSAFKKKQNELGMNIDPSIMTQKEIEGIISEVAKELECDAILTLYEKTKKVDTGGEVFRYLFAGEINIPVVIGLDMSSAKNGKTIWNQEHDVIYSTGDAGIINMPAEELRRILIPVVRPLVHNLIRTAAIITFIRENIMLGC